MPVREQIVRAAEEIAAIGTHYLTGCFGSRPGEADYVGRWLGHVYNNDWRSLAVNAARSKVNGLVCCGRYMTPDRKIPASQTADPPENDLGRWVRALPAAMPDKSGPAGVATLTRIAPYMGRYWPRRHEERGQYVYLGESCAGKRLLRRAPGMRARVSAPRAVESSPFCTERSSGEPRGRNPARTLRDRRADWCRRNGRGVSRSRHQAQSRRGHQGVARGVRG